MSGLLQRQVHSAVAIACLADGDAAGAREAAEAAERTGIVIPGVDDLHMFWMAQVALASGELAVARSRANIAVSASKRFWLTTALSTRARVRVAQREYEQAAADAYESLMIANQSGTHLATADTLECLARLASDAESQHAEAARLLGAAESTRQHLGLVHFKVFDDDHHALASALRNTMGDEDFDAAWSEGAALSTTEAIAYALRGRGERKRPSTGWGSLTRPSSTSSVWSTMGCPIRTSRLGCSSRRGPCSHISDTSTPSSELTLPRPARPRSRTSRPTKCAFGLMLSPMGAPNAGFLSATEVEGHRRG